METNTKVSSNTTENSDAQVISTEEACRITEAVLFAAGHPVTYDKLADVLGYSPSAVRKLILEYAASYNAPSEFPRGIMLLTFPDSCQLCTMEQYGRYIREALGIRRGGNLSTASIEVLAIIAYNEPVTRAYVDTVRGVDSSYAVSSLTEKQLIEPCGRLDVPGRPLLYRTTENFLRVFGIQSLSELPQIDLPKKTADSAPAPENTPSPDGHDADHGLSKETTV